MSRQVDYALQLIFALYQQKNSALSLKQFSTESSISFLFLQKIARSLKQAGLIDSVKGPTGGYTLALPADHITVKAVIDAVDGPYGVTACTRVETCRHSGNCQIEAGMRKLNEEIVQVLSKTRAIDMVL